MTRSENIKGTLTRVWYFRWHRQTYNFRRIYTKNCASFVLLYDLQNTHK